MSNRSFKKGIKKKKKTALCDGMTKEAGETGLSPGHLRQIPANIWPEHPSNQKARPQTLCVCAHARWEQ